MSETPFNFSLNQSLNSESEHQIKHRILVFSPQRDDLFLYKTVLEMWSYDVIEVRQFSELLKMIESSQPRIILLDGQLQFEKTLEIIGLIRQIPELTDIYLIVVSGYAYQRARDLAMNSGANEFFLKPIDFEELRKSIKKILLPGK